MIRLALPIVVVVMITGLALASFVASQIEVDVDVLEAITVEPTSFAINMRPGETKEIEFFVTNDSDADLTISFIGGISPEGQGVTVTLPATDDVEGNSFEQFEITVVAAGDAVPQLYRITVDVARE